MSKENAEPELLTMASLRRQLAETLAGLRSGKVDVATAQTICKVAHAILKSAEVQMQFERMRLANEVPANLPEMPLSPRLRSAG
jgi:hypothetical protein